MSQSVDKFQTPCKFCTFAQFEGKTQTGCLANRLDSQDHFEAYDEEAEFCVVNGLCTTYRPKTWNAGIPDVEKADGEANFKATILIDYNSLDFNSKWYFGQVDEFLKKNTVLLLVASHSLPQHEKMDILRKANDLRSHMWDVNVVFINEVHDTPEFGHELIKNIKTPIFIKVCQQDDQGIKSIVEDFRKLFITRERKCPFITTKYSIGLMTAAFSSFLNYDQEESKSFWNSFHRFYKI